MLLSALRLEEKTWGEWHQLRSSNFECNKEVCKADKLLSIESQFIANCRNNL